MSKTIKELEQDFQDAAKAAYDAAVTRDAAYDAADAAYDAARDAAYDAAVTRDAAYDAADAAYHKRLKEIEDEQDS